MRREDAYKINPNTANKLQLELAIQELKRTYKVSSNAFKRHGETTELMKSVEKRIELNPELYNKRVSDLTINEAREVFTTYRDYSARRKYNPDTGKFEGWRETVTRTRQGYLEYTTKVGKDILGNEQYSKMTQDEQKRIWDIIDKVRDMDKSVFLSSRISPDVRYQSGTNIKQIMEYIDAGVDDPVAILSKLNEEINTQEFIGNDPFVF